MEINASYINISYIREGKILHAQAHAYIYWT